MSLRLGKKASTSSVTGAGKADVVTAPAVAVAKIIPCTSKSRPWRAFNGYVNLQADLYYVTAPSSRSSPRARCILARTSVQHMLNTLRGLGPTMHTKTHSSCERMHNSKLQRHLLELRFLKVCFHSSIFYIYHTSL